MELDRNGLEVLSRAECLRLLASREVGRVGLTAGALPVVFPVHYCLVDGQVVFPATPGTSLERGTRDAVVAFQVDDLDLDGCSWSVLVTGIARALEEGHLLEHVRALPARWSSPGGECHLALPMDLVSGRRFPGG